MTEISSTRSFAEEHCISCGIPFLLPIEVQRTLKKSKDAFYCPNGHQMAYIKGSDEILKEKIAEKDRIISQLNDELRKAKSKKK